ncbi:DUF1700 domain-containing protein [Ligilactobacillus ceti]|uniref:Integral membrane protein n=1 Tax=Ligilactobacillus ceti DSM 22408 TaxID=1122146 RepID=A0A0R2KQ09_9LACO|nr:hypothetical protein [Ligilactobacillus ceti]KRN89637.1 hypothetical protein IV53_GL001187 [Ligilactobacillus ceti DSM 22408]
MNEAQDKYIAEVASYLGRLTPDEQADTLAFYKEYLADANFQKRSEIEKHLGSPRKLSRRILADHSIKLTEDEMKQTKKMNPRDNTRMIWLVLLALITSPVTLGIGGLLVVFVIVLLLMVLSAVFAVVSILAAVIVVAAFGIYSGIYLLFVSFWVGLFYLSVGIGCVALLMIALPIFYWIFTWLMQIIGKMTNGIYRKMRRKEKIA